MGSLYPLVLLIKGESFSGKTRYYFCNISVRYYVGRVVLKCGMVGSIDGWMREWLEGWMDE